MFIWLLHIAAKLTFNTNRAATQYQQNERNLKNKMGERCMEKDCRSKQQTLTRECLLGCISAVSRPEDPSDSIKVNITTTVVHCRVFSNTMLKCVSTSMWQRHIHRCYQKAL